ncbi:MAG: CDP-alcohol phosphatidyltransferase family protein [bacterium]|nr:MAG: CDP-alcohol phosphatidyltransferase family protein [bacterium]
MNEEKSNRFLTIPNLISIFRILLIFPLALCIWHNHLNIVLVLLLVTIASDFIDGIIARRFNQISEWGKILDPLADKLAIGTILIVLYFKQQVPLWLVIIVIGRDLAIIVAGLLLAKKYRHVIPSNFLGKMTANVLAVMLISYIFNIEILEKIFTPLAILFIFLSSFNYLKKSIRINKTGEQIM